MDDSSIRHNDAALYRLVIYVDCTGHSSLSISCVALSRVWYKRWRDTSAAWTNCIIYLIVIFVGQSTCRDVPSDMKRRTPLIRDGPLLIWRTYTSWIIAMATVVVLFVLTFITTDVLHHRCPSSQMSFITDVLHHRCPSSPMPFITSSQYYGVTTVESCWYYKLCGYCVVCAICDCPVIKVNVWPLVYTLLYTYTLYCMYIYRYIDTHVDTYINTYLDTYGRTYVRM